VIPKFSDRIKTWTLPVATGLIALIVYSITLVREVGWGDAAELSLAAYRLGVTHTPGYPVHSILGKLLMLFIAEPGVAVNLLSALGASVGVAIMSRLILQWTENKTAALLVPIQFALIKPVWDMAVIAEVYDFNLAFVALLILLMLAWEKNPSTKRLLAAAAVYGVSTGAFLANAFVVPAFLPMLWKQAGGRWMRFVYFFGLIGAIGLIVLAFSMVRAQTVPPLGTPYPPMTFGNALKFFTGYEASPFAVKTASFYVERTITQAKFFAKSYWYIGILFGVWGFIVQWRKQKNIAIFLGLMFLCNMAFFTYYQGVDFLVQVIQSYLVFSLWVGVGVADLIQRRITPRVSSAVPVALIVIALIGVQIAIQLPEKLQRAASREVTEFNVASLNHFPENAVVIALWERYASLNYFQAVHDLRPDVLLIERKGDIAPALAEYAGTRPILFDSEDALPADRFTLQRFYRRWFLLQP
jgi:hypothetical protein